MIRCQFVDVRMCPFLVKGCVIVDVRMQNWCVDAIFRGVRMCGACGRGALFLRYGCDEYWCVDVVTFYCC